MRRVNVAGPAKVDIEPRLRCRDQNIERLVEAHKRKRDGVRGARRRSHLRRQDRAILDIDDGMRAGAHEADFDRWPTERIARHAGVKRGAAAAVPAMRVNERRDLGFDLRVRQSLHDDVALPLSILAERQRLHGAAAALAVVLAEWGDAIGGRLDDFKQAPAFAVDFRAHGFPGSA